MGSKSKYRPEYCKRIVEIMSDGTAMITACVEFGISKQTLFNWCDAHPEFKAAYALAKQGCEAWWINEGKKATFGGVDGFNSSSYNAHMKNRFGWRDRVEQKIEVDARVKLQAISDDDLEKEIAELSE